MEGVKEGSSQLEAGPGNMPGTRHPPPPPNMKT